MVASILSAHAEGTALNRIASDMGVHHKTASKIIEAAEDHRRALRCGIAVTSGQSAAGPQQGKRQLFATTQPTV